MSNKSLGSKLDSAFTDDEIKEINEYGERLKQITTFINQYDGGSVQPYVSEKIYNEFIMPLEKRLEEAENLLDWINSESGIHGVTEIKKYFEKYKRGEE